MLKILGPLKLNSEHDVNIVTFFAHQYLRLTSGCNSCITSVRSTLGLQGFLWPEEVLFSSFHWSGLGKEGEVKRQFKTNLMEAYPLLSLCLSLTHPHAVLTTLFLALITFFIIAVLLLWAPQWGAGTQAGSLWSAGINLAPNTSTAVARSSDNWPDRFARAMLDCFIN